MKLYLISQNSNSTYDTYDSAVVCALSVEEARNIHPGNDKWGRSLSTWCNAPSDVTVEYIGEAQDAMPPGIVCASFNAG